MALPLPGPQVSWTQTLMLLHLHIPICWSFAWPLKLIWRQYHGNLKLSFMQLRALGLRDFEVSWTLNFVFDSTLWDGPDTKSCRTWNNIHYMPCTTSCRVFHPFKLPWSLRSSSSCAKCPLGMCALCGHSSFLDTYIQVVYDKDCNHQWTPKRQVLRWNWTYVLKKY